MGLELALVPYISLHQMPMSCVIYSPLYICLDGCIHSPVIGNYYDEAIYLMHLVFSDEPTFYCR